MPDAPLDLPSRKEERARRFVLVCGTIFGVLVVLMALIAWSVIPSIERDPEAVREEMRTLAGDLEIPAGFAPLKTVHVKPFGLISGRTATYAGPLEGQYVTASLYERAEELPGQARLELTDETEHELEVLGQPATARIGELPGGAEGAKLRVAVVAAPTDRGTLQVSVTGPQNGFDDEAALRVLRSIGR